MTFGRSDLQVILRTRDLQRQEAQQLSELCARGQPTEGELTELVRQWYGALSQYVTARLATQSGSDEVLVVTLSPPPKEQAVAAEKAYKRALDLAQEGRIREAVPLFHRAIELGPIELNHHMGLGHASLELGRLDEAESAFLCALRIDPHHFDTLTMLGNVYFAQGKLDLAGELYERSLAVAPTVQAMANLGAVQGKQGRLHEARATFMRALAVDPTYPKARHGLELAEQMIKAKR